MYNRGRQLFQKSELHIKFKIPGDLHQREFKSLRIDLFDEQRKKCINSEEFFLHSNKNNCNS